MCVSVSYAYALLCLWGVYTHTYIYMGDIRDIYIYIYIYIFTFFTHENLTYLEYDDWGSPRKNKFICLLTSPLCHALQHEIINLIYLFIYISVSRYPIIL